MNSNKKELLTRIATTSVTTIITLSGTFVVGNVMRTNFWFGIGLLICLILPGWLFSASLLRSLVVYFFTYDGGIDRIEITVVGNMGKESLLVVKGVIPLQNGTALYLTDGTNSHNVRITNIRKVVIVWNNRKEIISVKELLRRCYG